MARSTGIRRDLRLDLTDSYANYYHVNLRSYLGQAGDSYDRYLIRMNEMVESLYIISQLISKLSLSTKSYTTLLPAHIVEHSCGAQRKSSIWKGEYASMEGMVSHFKHWAEGCSLSSGWTYRAVESPKGEFGVSLIADNTNVPHRCKVRSASLHSLQVLPKMARGHFLADLAALIGTIDIVFGEVDR